MLIHFDRDGRPGAPLDEPHINSTNESIQAAMSISDHAQLPTSTPELNAHPQAYTTKKRKQVDEGGEPSKKTKIQDTKTQDEPPKVNLQ